MIIRTCTHAQLKLQDVKWPQTIGVVVSSWLGGPGPLLSWAFLCIWTSVTFRCVNYTDGQMSIAHMDYISSSQSRSQSTLAHHVQFLKPLLMSWWNILCIEWGTHPKCELLRYSRTKITDHWSKPLQYIENCKNKVLIMINIEENTQRVFLVLCATNYNE